MTTLMSVYVDLPVPFYTDEWIVCDDGRVTKVSSLTDLIRSDVGIIEPCDLKRGNVVLNPDALALDELVAGERLELAYS